MNAAEKLKDTIFSAPLGAGIGGVLGYVIAKKVGYHHTLSVVGFVMVGVILGGTIGYKLKNK